MGIRGVLGRGLEDFLLGLAPYGPFTAREHIGAIELIGHLPLLYLRVASWPLLRDVVALPADTWAEADRVEGMFRVLLNLIWLLLAGLERAIGYAIGGVLMMLTIVGIPFGIPQSGVNGSQSGGRGDVRRTSHGRPAPVD